MAQPSDVYVYVIALVRDGELSAPVKVGISSKPLSRLRELQTAAPYQLAMVANYAVPDRNIAQAVEACFHGTQKDHRTHGEWFDIPPSRAAKILLIQINWSIRAFTDLSDEEITACMKMVRGES